MKNKSHRKKHHNEKKFQSLKNETIQGELLLTSKGLAFVKTNEIPEDIKIDQNNLNTALHKDIVEVSVTYKKKGEKMRGNIKKVIQRAKTKFVGYIEKEGNSKSLKKNEQRKIFIPDDKKIYVDFDIIPNEILKRVQSNQKIVLEMEPWTNPKEKPRGKIIETLGQRGEHNAEMESIIYEKGFVPKFDQNIEDEAQKIKEMAPTDFDTEIQKRISVSDAPPSTWDFRNTITFTIDPFDAKDFDDALSFKDLGDGTYEVGIHIADVSHYVKEGSVIDKEAIKRGTSVYLVDRTIPMLPEVLSNDLCSLNPNEDKLAFSAIFILNDKCEVLKRWFGESIINSNKRFSYKDAQNVLNNGKGEFHKELRKLEDLALLKRKRRTKNGALTFSSAEVQFELDKTGFPIAVHEKVMLDTNYLIEDFMLLANREVSEYIDRLDKKNNTKNIFVYRIHDKPKAENIIELSKYLEKIGYKLNSKDGHVSSQEINDLLDKIVGTDEESLIEKAVLKSMAKAIYSTNNIGHYGLAFEFYTHFTSPIRRYPDLMVHRLMKKYLKGEKILREEIKKYNQLCASSSQQEVLAMGAERDSVKYKYTEYMSKRMGEEFDGIISSIVSWGVYVQDIKTKAEGLVRVSTLKGDYYNIDPQNYRLIGERTGKKYTLGDKIKIKLIGVDLERKTIDFEMVD